MTRNAFIVLTLTLGLLAGCLERDEKIKVDGDGSVAVEVTTTADGREEFTPGRVPTAAGGWAVREATVEVGQGEQRRTRYQVIATRQFAPGAALPSRDGEPSDPQAEAFVDFPTTVTVESRPDGKVYHFRRVYKARPWLFVAAYDQRPGHEQIKQLQERGPQMSAQEWQRVIRFGAETEALKKLAIAREAALVMQPRWPQDHWLAARQQVLEVARQVEAAKLAELLQAPQTPQRDAELTAQARAFEGRIEQAIQDAAAKLPPAQQQRFADEYAQVKAKYQVTADQVGQRYRIRVELPGTPLGSNADRMENGHYVWDFSGERFTDRDLELLASSFVAGGK